MKKIMILLAAAVMMMACAGNEVEKKAEQYVQQLLEALVNEDFATVMAVSVEVEEWQKTLSEEDQVKADEAGKAAAEKWVKKNLPEEKQAQILSMME